MEKRFERFIMERIEKKLKKKDINMSIYYIFMLEQVKNLDKKEKNLSYLKSLKNIESKKCPRCKTHKKSTFPICLGDNLLSLSIMCDECGLNYSGLKIPREYYEELIDIELSNFVEEAELIELIRFLKEDHSIRNNEIKQAYYRDWEKRLIEKCEPNQASGIIYNWNQVCSNCQSKKSKDIKEEKEQEIGQIEYIIYSYKCGNCGKKLGNIRISKNSLNENIRPNSL